MTIKKWEISGLHLLVLILLILASLLYSGAWLSYSSERVGFGDGYACAFDQLNNDSNGLNISFVELSPYCVKFHKEFIKQKSIQMGVFE